MRYHPRRHREHGRQCRRLLRGEIDVVQSLQPYVEELVESGCHVWYAAANRGSYSYTDFYARDRVLEAKRDELIAIIRGLYATTQWVHASDATTLASTISDYFFAILRPRLIAALARYKTLDI